MLRKLSCSMLLFATLLAGAEPPTNGTIAETCEPWPGLRIYLHGPTGSLQLLYGHGDAGILQPHHAIPMMLFSCHAPTCVDLGKATVVFDTFDYYQGASGTYTVKQVDGSILKGSFKVVREKQPKPFICE